MRLRYFLPLLFVATPLLAQTSHVSRPEAPLTSPLERDNLHRGPEWETISPHLPDPFTGTAAQLETAGDVLRARRFPEDALDFYGYAMARGGNVSQLLNKMGVVRLELHQNDLAREMFQRTVRAQKRNAVAWNNLGVTEYADQNYRAAISDYRHASSIDRRSAVYHSNLAMAYFEKRDTESARKEFATALRLDPAIFHNGDMGGLTAHVVGTQNYGELCFEMAKLYMRQGLVRETMDYLTKSEENGYDVRPKMKDDAVLSPLLKSPEMKLMLDNADGLRGRRSAAATIPAPPLGSGVPDNQPKNLD